MLAEWRIVEDRAACPPALTAVVRLRGGLDISVRPLLTELLGTLAARRIDRLELDLHAVSYLDCAAAGLLVELARVMLPPGSQPVILVASPPMRRLLVLSGLDEKCLLQAPAMHKSRGHGKTGGTAVVAPAAVRVKQ
jgi:anti-anti-sigma factor